MFDYIASIENIIWGVEGILWAYLIFFQHKLKKKNAKVIKVFLTISKNNFKTYVIVLTEFNKLS